MEIFNEETRLVCVDELVGAGICLSGCVLDAAIESLYKKGKLLCLYNFFKLFFYIFDSSKLDDPQPICTTEKYAKH